MLKFGLDFRLQSIEVFWFRNSCLKCKTRIGEGAPTAHLCSHQIQCRSLPQLWKKDRAISPPLNGVKFRLRLRSILLANVNSCSCSLYVVVRPSVVCHLSVVCNVRAPYSGDWNFRQCFYAIWYLGHLWPFGKNCTEIISGEPLRRGLNQRGVEKCSDFGPFQGYISETVQNRM